MGNRIIVDGDVAQTLKNLESYVGQIERGCADPDEGNIGLHIMSMHSIEAIKWLRSSMVNDTLNK